MATIQYDTKTGKKLTSGQSTIVNGVSVRQGSTYNAPGSSSGGSLGGGSSSVINIDSNPGQSLAPGQAYTYQGNTYTQPGGSSTPTIGSSPSLSTPINIDSNPGQILNPGQTYTYQGQTYTQAGTPTPPSNILPTDTIGNNPKVTIPDQPLATDYTGLLNGLNGTNVNDTANAGINVNTQNNADILTQFQDLIGTPPSTADAYQKAQQQTDLLNKQQTVNDLTANLNQIVTQGQAASLQLESNAGGKGVTSTFLSRQQQEISRNVAIQALPVSAQLNAATANLQTAQQNVDTLFKIYSTDLTNAYNYRVQIATAFKEVATKSEDAKLNIFLKQIETQQTQTQAMLADGKSYAKIAFANGQSSLGAKIMGLNPNSPTYQQELVKLITEVKDPNMALDLSIKRQQLANLQKTNSLMGEPTAKEKKDEALALKSAQGQTGVLKEKVSLIDSILESDGIHDSVGTNPFGRGIKGAYNSWTGVNQQFAGGVHKLASREFLDALIGAKAQGATFGALTDREGDALRAAATQLNDWEIKDKNGLGTGVWNIDEESFKKELNNLKRLANTGIQNAQGTVLEQEEQSLLDNIFSPDNMAIDPGNYY